MLGDNRGGNWDFSVVVDGDTVARRTDVGICQWSPNGPHERVFKCDCHAGVHCRFAQGPNSHWAGDVVVDIHGFTPGSVVQLRRC